MKLAFPFVLLLCFCSGIKAQDAIFSLYRQNHLFYNPAYAGVEDKHVFSLSGRQQWESSNFLGKHTYSTAALTYDQPLKKINSGIGAILMYDVSGDALLTTYYAGLCYKYNFKLGEKMSLGVGVQPAFSLRTIDNSRLTFGSQFNGTGFDTTALLPTGKIQSTNPTYFDLDAGVWYKWSELFIGISVNHIIRPDISFDNNGSPDRLYISLASTAGYTFKVSKQFSMTPSVFYMRQGPNHFLQVSDEVSYKEIIYLGAGFRPIHYINPVTVNGGVKIKKKLQLTLSYDFINPELPGELKSFWSAYEANVKFSF